MKIAWITPVSRRSAIARMAMSVAGQLASRGYELEIVRAESDAEMEGEIYEGGFRIVPPTLFFPERYDLGVVHIGDYYGFHAAFFETTKQLPCVGVFHDYYLYDLFAGWLHATKAPPSVQERLVIETYGPAKLELARRIRTGEAGLEAIAEQAPMTEWFAKHCVGALAHSAYYLDRLAAGCAGPVSMAHLPWEGRGVAPLSGRGRDEVRIVTLGVMNANKCADAVIAAICASPILRDRVTYHLVGGIQPEERERLTALAREGGFEGLSILGTVDEATLVGELEAADIVSCLRKPVLEGASASAIEGMLSGRPTVVANAGFYRELPDDLVFKVDPAVRPEDVREVLERLAGDEALRRATGERARAWAETHFTAERYADELDALIRAALLAQPWLRLGRVIGDQLASLGLPPQDPSVERIAGALEVMAPPLA